MAPQSVLSCSLPVHRLVRYHTGNSDGKGASRGNSSRIPKGDGYTMNEYLAVSIPKLAGNGGDLKVALVEDPTSNNYTQGFDQQDKCCWCAKKPPGSE